MKNAVKKKRGGWRFILPFLLIGVGVILAAYPWISNWVYENNTDSTVESFKEESKELSHADIDAMKARAEEYNKNLRDANIVALSDPFVLQEDSINISYNSVLDINGSGLMCTISIPKINVNLPVYRGTSEDVLKRGVGHLESTSFPIGGLGTHAVLSAHTGLSTAKLFTDLTELRKGDLFFIDILGERLAYRVCSIQVILPEETSSLTVQKDKDLVSLLTCTPYGVNSHRLVVTGTHVEYTEEVAEEAENTETVTDTQWMRAYKKAFLMGLILVLLFLILGKVISSIVSKKGVKNEKIK